MKKETVNNIILAATVGCLAPVFAIGMSPLATIGACALIGAASGLVYVGVCRIMGWSPKLG